MYPSVARNAAPRFESSSGRSRSLRSTGNGSDRYSGANRQSGVGERAQALYEQAGTKLDRAEDAMLEGAARGRDVIQEKWMQARQASRDLAQDNPLALALGTLVLGIGVGMLLPATTRENALLGPTRDKLNRAMSQVRGTARDLGTVAADTAKQSMADLEGRVHH